MQYSVKKVRCQGIPRHIQPECSGKCAIQYHFTVSGVYLLGGMFFLLAAGPLGPRSTGTQQMTKRRDGNMGFS